MALIDVLNEARATRDWGRLVAAVPYSRFFDIGFREDGEQLVTVMPFKQDFIGNPVLPALHGGAIGAFMEMTGVFTVLRAVDTPGLPKTINITVEYLRSGGPRDTYAVGVPTRLGRRITNLRVEAWQTDRGKPIAAANMLFLMPQATPPEPRNGV